MPITELQWPRWMAVAAGASGWLVALAVTLVRPGEGQETPVSAVSAQSARSVTLADSDFGHREQRASSASERLTDARGRALGEVVLRADGALELKDPQGRWLGRFDPVANRTTDARGATVGYGNLLAMLLCEPEGGAPRRRG